MSTNGHRNCALVLAALAAMTTGVAGAQSSILATMPEPAAPSETRSQPAETTAAAVVDPEWKAPRTSWGHPSLEGVWSSDDMRSVPMNRPAAFGTRESLTQEEFLDRASRDQGAQDDGGSFLQHEYGIRTFGYTSRVIDPPDGRMPALTEAGRQMNATRTRGTYGPGPYNTFEDFTLYDRCITRGPLGSIMPSIYGNGVRITQSPTHVTVTSEMIHETRIIRLDDDRPLDGRLPKFTGNSRGYWDGDTLVVESAGFTVGSSAAGVPHSDKFRMVERFTRVDPDMVEYRATIEDPVSLSAPFTLRTMLTTQPDFILLEYDCHEGNYALPNSLSGERVYEQQVAEAIANGQPVPRRATEHTEIRNTVPDFVFDINRGE